MSVAGDVFVTVSLAGTLFFDVGVGAARPKVLLYLILTMAPFAVIAPVIGPFLDRTRGGRRLMVVISMLGRGLVCIFMARHVDGLLLYPLAFAALVLSKAMSVAKSSLVPSVVEDKDELVLANSRLALVAITAGVLAGPIAAGILKLVGAAWVLRAGTLVFLAGALAALAIPSARAVAAPETAGQRDALHAASIVAAGTAMALLRGVVGFFTFFAAFELKRAHEPAWMFGVIIIGSAVGNGLGAVVAPFLRRRTREEWILAGSLVVPAIPLVFAARAYTSTALLAGAASVATAAACGRLAFDSLVQRDGAEAARGRAFARFETRFQLVWVGGGVLAVLYPGGGRGGIFLVAVVLLFAGLSYLGTVRHRAAGNPATPARGGG